MSETIQRVRDLIESRLQELNEEAKGLESAVQSFRKDGVPARRGRRSGQSSGGKAPQRATRAKRAAPGQRRREFLEAVSKNPGDTASSIAKAIEISSNQAYALARQLVQEGAIQKAGKGYRPVG